MLKSVAKTFLTVIVLQVWVNAALTQHPSVESGVCVQGSMTVTEIKQVPYAEVKDIRFEGKKSTHPKESKSHSPTDIATPNEEKIKMFYSSLASCSSKPAILALVESTKSLDPKFPMSLSQLFKPLW